MNRQNRASDGLRVDSAASNHTQDRASMSPSFSLASVPPVNPEPAYIAAAAAANVVAGEIAHEFHIELSDGASVSQGSLHLINTFLDRLLYNFLSCARSTSLGALRPAVTEVLRPRLAKEAIAGADEELEEYLGGDSEELDLINGEKSTGPWDLDIAWKRTRLRCMLYTRLGDMEEEEEETYLEQDNLQEGGQPGAQVQPAVAIFLTSVLEFIGEHALMIAAQAAYKRHETKARIENVGFRKLTVEEVDMEKNALNSTLGRLWRSWRASLRSPRGSLNRIPGMGPRGFRGFSVSSRSSLTTESHLPEEADRVPVVEEVAESIDPSSIPLPLTIYDVDEIEVPGYSVEYAQRTRKADDRLRPESLFVRPGSYTYEEVQLENESFDGETDDEDISEEATPTASSYQRRRASSLPAPETPVFVYTASSSEHSFITPQEEVMNPTELQPQANSIIDMSGNTVPVIGDYAIPKSNSAPTSPYGGSMLNAISASAAQGLAGQTFYHEDDSEHDNDPAEGALQFDRNDYEVGEHEHSNIGSRVSTIEPAKNLQAPFDYPMAVSPLVGPTENPVSGAVSPLDSEFPRQEISPLDESDDEHDSYVSKKSDIVKPLSPASPATAGSIAAITTPLVTTTAAVATVGAAAAAAAVVHERKQERSEEPIDTVVVPRANQGRQRSREGPTSQDYTKEENREAFVIPQEINLAQPPDETPRSVPEPEARKWRQPEKTTVATSNLPAVRESLERQITPPSSHDQSSPTRQYPVSRKAVPAQKPVPSVSQQRQYPKVATDVDQITGQRIVSSPVSAKDPNYSSRSSDNNIRSSGPTKAVAKNKGRVNSLSNDHRDSVQSRSSSEGQKSASYDRFSRSSTSNSDPHRDFDQLINSGETLQYTLTSQTLREIEERGRESGQKSTSPIQLRGRTTSSEQYKSGSQNPSPQSMNGLRSNPISELPTAPFVVHAGPQVKRGPQLVAKDARMEKTNTSELKDFFRSTGPEGGSPAASAVSNRMSGPIPRSPKNMPKNDRLLGAESVQRQATTGSNRPKPKFEPREATRSQGDTAMLAEFFRQGPPGASRTSGKQTADDVGGRFRDAPSVASTQDSVVARSVQSSTNSRVGLLDSTRAYNNVPKASPSWDKRNLQLPEEPAGPVRKQRRVRDPYAIDTDSEDEDETGTPKAQEESLLDFLRNAEPPSEQSITPPPIGYGGRANDANRKSGGSAIKSRFGSTNKKPAQTSANPPRAVSNPTNFSQNYKPDSGNTGTYNNFQSDAYSGSQQQQPTRSYTENFSGPTPKLNGNGVRQARKMARDSRDNSASVRDLAEFLRSTEPPPSSSYQPPLPPTPAKEESGGFSRMFSRRKKSVIA